MANTLSKTGISTSSEIKAAHVTQSVDALTGDVAYDITISGSLKVTGSTNITGSLNVTHGVTGSYTGSFIGDGTNLTGVTAEWDGTHNGDATITGSLILSGSGDTKLDVKGDISASGNISSSVISGSEIYILDGLKVDNITPHSPANTINFHESKIRNVYDLYAQETITGSAMSASNGFHGTSSWSISSSHASVAESLADSGAVTASIMTSGSITITGSLIITGSVQYLPVNLLCSGAADSPATMLGKHDRVVFLRNTRTAAADVGTADLDISPIITSTNNLGKTIDIYIQASSGNKNTILKNPSMTGTTYVNGTQSANQCITIASSSGDDDNLNCWVRITGMGYESCSIVSNQSLDYM